MVVEIDVGSKRGVVAGNCNDVVNAVHVGRIERLILAVLGIDVLVLAVENGRLVSPLGIGSAKVVSLPGIDVQVHGNRDGLV